MLSFAAVGSHGREWCTRLVILALAVAPAAAQNGPADSLSLAIRTLIATRTPILDVLESGDRLVVLTPEAISLYTTADALSGAPAIASVVMTHTRPWPRDVRGQLRATGPARGATGFQALLPGVICRGTLRPFAASCADDTTNWSLLDSNGIEPSRNYFSTSNGLQFYSEAFLGNAGWLVVDTTGRLMFLNPSRVPMARADAADDVARIGTACATGPLVVATSRSSQASARDDIRLLSVGETTLTPVSTLTLPGEVTALWTSWSSTGIVTVVVHDPGSSRYEAHHLTVACAR